MKPTKRATIIYLVNQDDNTVLMARKMLDVGAGYWFGYGGKIEEGENEDDCICREVIEESGGVSVDKKDLQRVALIDFYKGEERPLGNPTFRVLCYRAKVWTGSPSPTEEMTQATFFDINNLPWNEMKPGDELFVPQIIAGTPIKGWMRFTEDSKKVIDSSIIPCSEEDLVI
jgi:8-oxo-dGTP diphosphatase